MNGNSQKEIKEVKEMSEINLDRELNDKFEKIFGQTAEKGEASESMLAKRIKPLLREG